MATRILTLPDGAAGGVPVAEQDLAKVFGWAFSKITADATPVALNAEPGMELEANTVYGFEGMVVARYAGASTGGAYRVQGAVKKGAANANTALVGTPLITAYEDTAGMDLGITADTTNGRLTLTATGVAATSIVWKAFLRIYKVGATL